MSGPAERDIPCRRRAQGSSRSDNVNPRRSVHALGMPLPATDLARLFVACTLLAFASYTDWRWRRAPNVLWAIMLGCALAILAVDAALDFEGVRSRWPYLLGALAFAAIVYGFWYVGLIAGGADAKAIMALAVLLPFPLALAPGVPAWESPLPGAVAVLANSLLAALLVPIVTFVANVARGDFALPFSLLGYRKPVASLDAGHAWPMEWVDDEGNLKRALFASRRSLDLEEQKERLAAKGVAKVWVTPKVPFMIPLLAGLVLAFTAGDVLFAAVGALLGPP